MPPKNLLELTNEFSKLAFTEMQEKLIYNNLLHFYTLTTNYQKEKRITFTPSSKRIKYLGSNLSKRPIKRKL